MPSICVEREREMQRQTDRRTPRERERERERAMQLMQNTLFQLKSLLLFSGYMSNAEI